MCRAYTLLLRLLDLAKDTWNDRAMTYVNKLRQCEELLGQTCAEIEMAEELLATAFSFNALERRGANVMDMKGYGESLGDVESDWIAKQEGRLNGFERLYDGFRKIARLVTSQHEDIFSKRAAISMLGVFLEPLRVKGNAVGSFDSQERQERCEHLVRAVSRTESGDEFLEWFYQEVFPWRRSGRKGGLWGGWGEILRLWTEQLQCSWVARDLWEISRGRRLEEKDVRNVREDTINCLSDNAPELVDRPLAVLRPVPVPDEAPVVWVIAAESSDVKQKQVPNGRILFLDGLRQQFSRGSSIRCPYAGLGASICSNCGSGRLRKEVKQVLRLALWAAQGRFGDGAWTWSPCPYAHPYPKDFLLKLESKWLTA